MLIGDTRYYCCNLRGTITALADFDSDIPCRAKDANCAADEIQVWECKNGERATVIGAGSAVRDIYPTDEEILANLP